MRSKPKMIASILATVLLLTAVVPIAALGTPIQEAALSPEGGAYELNRDAAGNLFLSDYFLGDVWQVDAATNAYRVFEGVTPQVMDARPDGTGQIWWTDNLATFGRIDPSGADPSVAQVTSWTLDGVDALYGLAVDEAGRVWLPEWRWSDRDSRLYRFDPDTGELCTYSWPDGVSSYYVVVQGGQVWLGNWDFDRIQRFDPAAGEVTYWQIDAGGEPVDLEPTGLALDESQNLWWADSNLGALARLEPEEDRITLFALPVGSFPQMIVPVEGRMAFTDYPQGTVGTLDPSVAAGTATDVIRGTLAAEANCETLGAGQPAELGVRSGDLAWTRSAASPVWNKDGWLVYQLPVDGAPHGVAVSQGLLWATDPGRQKLVRFPLIPEWSVYLPLVTRAVGP